ncbi:MAG: hypothetical protein M3N09_08220 [Actinomycetota bacterium]|nr:hypothetical protein [Actinomycetota bacterium]
MKTSNVVVLLSALIAVLALVAAGAGLFWQGGDGPYSFTTLRGQTAEIYGQGLYRYDTLFSGAGYKGQDAVVLFLGIPLLVVSTLIYRRGSLRGGLLLVGTLAYFLYTYASMALGATYNELFLLYVALFSISLYAFVLAFTAIDLRTLGSRFSARMPRLGPAIFMLASGLVTLVVWGGPIVSALIGGEPPERLDTYTTKFTEALDLATITPATFLAGVLILRREPLGYLIALSLLVLEAMLAPLIVTQTVFQVSAGVTYPLGQIVGPITGFVSLAVVAIWITVAILRNISDSATSGAARVR